MGPLSFEVDFEAYTYTSGIRLLVGNLNPGRYCENYIGGVKINMLVTGSVDHGLGPDGVKQKTEIGI